MTSAKLPNGAVTNSKIATGAVTADKLAPDAAPSYARIEENGVIDPSQSKGIGGMTVTRVRPGEYCISNLPFTPKSVVASSQYSARVVNTYVGASEACSEETQVSYEVTDELHPSSAPVMILFN